MLSMKQTQTHEDKSNIYVLWRRRWSLKKGLFSGRAEFLLFFAERGLGVRGWVCGSDGFVCFCWIFGNCDCWLLWVDCVSDELGFWVSFCVVPVIVGDGAVLCFLEIVPFEYITTTCDFVMVDPRY